MVYPLDLHFLGIPQVVAAFMVKTNDGPVLIETGPHATFPALKSALAQHGFTPNDIKHVFLSHIHLDHAGAAWALAQSGATIYVHPQGQKHLAEPGRLMESARRIYQGEMDRLWGEMNPIPMSQIQTPAHGQPLQIGGQTFTPWYTPGHAIHHIAWQWDNNLFTGDVAGVRIGNGPVVPPCPPPDIDLESWTVSLQLIRDLDPKTLWLTHFGPETNCQNHLNTLEKRLFSYANWIADHFPGNSDLQQLTLQFEQFAQEDLKAAGVQGIGLQQYQAANPAWMSVAGLVRYWQKKSSSPPAN